jgi:glycosyltransferase involved in cell wall biosynthesis
MTKGVKNILCVHQGYELYGSDRSFALSVGILRKMYPNAIIDIIIPKEGEIRSLLIPICDNLIINEKLAILRKTEVKKNIFRLIYNIFRGIFNAISNSKNYDVFYINTIVVLDYIIASRFTSTTNILHIREISTGIQKNIFSKMLSFSKMKVIFNSINTANSYYLPSNQIRATILNGVTGYPPRINNIKNKIINILLLGRLTEWKGQMFFLETIKMLVDLGRYIIQVRIVGDVFDNQQKYKDKLIQFVKTNNLESIVTFKLFVKNPELEYAWSNIVVVPSIKPEPFGRVAIESMSMGRCVLAANHGGLPEIISHNKDGVLFEPNDSDSLMSELIELLEDPKKIVKYGDNSKATFYSRFSDAVYERNFKEVIRKYLSKG